MRDVVLSDIDQSVKGFWRILAHPGRYTAPNAVDVTSFRGVPPELTSMSFSDPFGPKSATIRYPMVSYFEQLGAGDLWWLQPWSALRLRWVGPLPADYYYGGIKWRKETGKSHPVFVEHTPSFSWMGQASSFSWDDAGGLSVEYRGAYYQLDDYQAKPTYPHRPLPYEWVIAQQFQDHPHLKLGPLKIWWPEWWDTTYTPPAKDTPPYMVPAHLQKGDFWNNLTTRETGKWEPIGTSFIQTLLSAMQTRRGRWTIDVFNEGHPVLLHRDIKKHPDSHTVVISGVGTNKFSLSEDWTQSLGVIYGQGTSLAGEQYSGMQVSPDGTLTRYEPMAALRQLHPENARHNDWLEPGRARREVMIQMQTGLDELQAHQVAQAHLERFAEPGITGTVTLYEDPTINGVPVSRMLVRAGMQFQVPHLFGRREGMIGHIVSNEVDFVEETNTLTIDTKYRDALTVSEVRLRGRDALNVPRLLAVGQYTPPVQDQLIPWNYNHGSGFLPKHSQELFDEMPMDAEFPWEDWTRKHPPSNANWRHCYVRIRKASKNANLNWAARGGLHPLDRKGIPVFMAQAGDIRLFQVAAYDSGGNVIPVSFHVSWYTNRGVNVQSMPRIPAYNNDPASPGYYPIHHDPFNTGQAYPFVKDGWNRYTSTGVLTNAQIPHPTSTAGLVRGYGDYYERAGYWPGSFGRGDPATGLLVDESTWHFDTTEGGRGTNTFDPQKVKQPKWAGLMYAMIYCDDQGTEPVYFLGRAFRAEPTQQGGGG